MTTTWHTDREIAAQPRIWREWAEKLGPLAQETRTWLLDRAPGEIWLCGAGTSAFIGDSLATTLSGKLGGIPVRAVATTDLVSRPMDYLGGGRRPLVISFGRSGNSSESIGVLKLLDKHAPEVDRLNITCNGDSALATASVAGPGQQRVIVLPPECHDQGFAMTSSYTTMLLTAIACLSPDTPNDLAATFDGLATAAEQVLVDHPDIARPARAVFLGSGPFIGTARESALKVLELTAGEVVTSWDSTLGFRHGPKAIVNNDTLVVIYMSSDPTTRQYDQDIAKEIRGQFPRATVITVGGKDADIPVSAAEGDVWNTAVYVIVAQLLATAWSKSLSLPVDNPFTDGNLTRVVSDVRLYI